MKKILSLMLMLALCCSLTLAFPLSASAAPVDVQDLTALKNALSGGASEIRITDNILIDEVITIPPGVTLSDSDTAVTLTIDSAGKLNISAGATVDLQYTEVLNHGEIIIENGGVFSIEPKLFNYGAITNDGVLAPSKGIEDVGGTVTGAAPYFDAMYYTYQVRSTINEQLNVTSATPVTFSSTDIDQIGFSLTPDGRITGIVTDSFMVKNLHATVTATNASGSFTQIIHFVAKDEENLLVLDPFPIVTDSNATGITVRIDVEYSAFSSQVTLDHDNGIYLRQLSEGTDFTSANGSTIITLLPSFLQTLSNGNYKILVMFAGDSYVNVPLVVNIPGPFTGTTTSTTTAASPQTGDASNLPLWITLSGLAVLGLAGLGLYSKKKRVQ